MIPAIRHTFQHLHLYLQVLKTDAYTLPIPIFGNSSIGQHTRHIIEFFSCLLAQQGTGSINYDLRERNTLIETDPQYAHRELQRIAAQLSHIAPHQVIYLQTMYQTQPIATTAERELAYLLEHTVHHLATIRVALQQVAPDLKLPSDFGVAKATVAFHQTTAPVCAT